MCVLLGSSLLFWWLGLGLDFLCNSINVTASFGLTFNSDLHSYSCRLGYLLFILYLKYNSSEFIHVLVEEI